MDFVLGCDVLFNSMFHVFSFLRRKIMSLIPPIIAYLHVLLNYLFMFNVVVLRQYPTSYFVHVFFLYRIEV